MYSEKSRIHSVEICKFSPTIHTATAEARKLSTICEKFGKKFRQIDAHIFHLIEMLDYAILNGLYL